MHTFREKELGFITDLYFHYNSQKLGSLKTLKTWFFSPYSFKKNISESGTQSSHGIIKIIVVKWSYCYSLIKLCIINELPRWHSCKESICQHRRLRRSMFDSWVNKIPWRRKWQLNPVFLPRKFHGQRSLAGYSPRCCKELDMTQQLNIHTLSII